jgi:hypothetical protein
MFSLLQVQQPPKVDGRAVPVDGIEFVGFGVLGVVNLGLLQWESSLSSGRCV